MQFKEVIGHAALKQKLISTARQGRVSHSQLFLGEEGTGVLPLAIAYIQFINCLQPSDDDSCGTCTSCVKMQKYIHPDVHFTYPTIAVEKKKLSTDFIQEWREALLANPYMSETDWLLTLDNEGKKQGNITAFECREIIKKVSLTAYEAKVKAILIWMPEYLKQEGNILLKMLEEPPDKTVFILVAQDTEKVLSTILSRTQLVKVGRIADADVMAALQNKYQLGATEASVLARISEGDYAMACRLVSDGNLDYLNLLRDWLRCCYNARSAYEPLSSMIDQLSAYGKEYLKSFVGYALYMFRSSVIYNKLGKDHVNASEEEWDHIQKFSPLLKDYNVHEIITAFNETLIYIERNADIRITFLNLSLYIGTLLRLKPIEQ